MNSRVGRQTPFLLGEELQSHMAEEMGGKPGPLVRPCPRLPSPVPVLAQEKREVPPASAGAQGTSPAHPGSTPSPLLDSTGFVRAQHLSWPRQVAGFAHCKEEGTSSSLRVSLAFSDACPGAE